MNIQKSDINLDAYTQEEIITALHYWLYDREKKKEQFQKYASSDKGKERQRLASMRYYYKSKDYYHPFLNTAGAVEMKFDKSTQYDINDFPSYCNLT